MKSERKKLVKKLDDVFSLYIRHRDNFCCFICGKVKSISVVIQCGHLITRGKQSVKWDERNAHAQCRGCNLKHEYQPEHYNLKFIKKYGKAKYERLILESNIRPRFTNDDLLSMLRIYKEKLAKLKQRQMEDIPF